jgi:hypothetical protein
MQHSPLEESPSWIQPSSRAAGNAAAGDDLSDVHPEEGLLTQPRARLLARLKGLAGKAGHAIGVAFLDHLGPDAVQRLLRHQRDGHDGKLVGEAVKLLAGYLAADPTELGAAVAAEAKGQKPPEGPPPTPQPSARPEERRPDRHRSLPRAPPCGSGPGSRHARRAGSATAAATSGSPRRCSPPSGRRFATAPRCWRVPPA